MATAGNGGPTKLALLAGIVSVLLASTMAAAPQEGRRTIYVTVVDRNGLPVGGLSGADRAAA
jgi:hypothetical protein